MALHSSRNTDNKLFHWQVLGTQGPWTSKEKSW